MKTFKYLVSLCLFTTLLSFSAIAKNVTTSAIMSPGCSAAQIKKLAGNALISISKQQHWRTTHGYIIKLDTDKMKKHELIMKMNKEKCFTQTQ